MPIPDEFAAESLYDQDHWYIHDVLEIDREPEQQRVVGLCDTERLVEHPLVAAQRPWPGQPKHVPGIVMVQITGTLGNIHAVCVLGLRMSEGWVGFGTNIHEARFGGLGRLGPPLICELKVERMRELKGQMFGTYAFRFEQDGKTIYRSRQSASWLRPGGE
ncbi:MAG: hypothetical protein HC927_12280 [Deltaproteobacteria bacterium]|nr:hypothetical protein [Deltaproteobacteria bacterium]